MPYLIAEIGFNHGGDVDLAARMIEAAADAGADAVKFQSFTADDLYFPGHEAYAIFAAGELGEEDHHRLKRVADRRGIDFLSTPLGVRWVDFLDRLGVPGFKIASMDVANPVLLDAVGRCGKRVYLSTGGATVDEIRTGVDRLAAAGASSVCVLHCVSNYPTRPDEAALATIPLLRSLFGDDVGFSDHTLGVAVPTGAVALGARVIEKHFTIDNALPGPDNATAADPVAFAALVAAAREVEAATAATASLAAADRPDGAKRSIMRRSAYAAAPIAAGEIITLDRLRLVRPEGAPLGETLALRLGKPATKKYDFGEPV
jgi:sialic acid synthase SpsE